MIFQYQGQKKYYPIRGLYIYILQVIQLPQLFFIVLKTFFEYILQIYSSNYNNSTVTKYSNVVANGQFL